MTKTFKEKWLEASGRKDSVLCAGLDPAEFEMGRGDKGLAEHVSKRDFGMRYVEAVASDAAVLKPNFQYWKGMGDMEPLFEICDLARSKGMLVIDDSKLADIGSTNDAGVYYAAQRADAVTFSPFAGNMEEAAKQARARGIGLISMVLMSNPEFDEEKNHFVNVAARRTEFRNKDKSWLGVSYGPVSPYVKKYVQLAHDAGKFGVDGIVVGAPSDTNHIRGYELSAVRHYFGEVILVPGVGAQGGEVGAIYRHFPSCNVIVNAGRSLMLPEGSKSTPDNQKDRAGLYKRSFNTLRAA